MTRPEPSALTAIGLVPFTKQHLDGTRARAGAASDAARDRVGRDARNTPCRHRRGRAAVPQARLRRLRAEIVQLSGLAHAAAPERPVQVGPADTGLLAEMDRAASGQFTCRTGPAASCSSGFVFPGPRGTRRAYPDGGKGHDRAGADGSGETVLSAHSVLRPDPRRAVRAGLGAWRREISAQRS